jgi:hypothetical protein
MENINFNNKNDYKLMIGRNTWLLIEPRLVTFSLKYSDLHIFKAATLY